MLFRLFHDPSPSLVSEPFDLECIARLPFSTYYRQSQHNSLGSKDVPNVGDAYMLGLKPPKMLSIKEYAERHIRLGADTPIPGLVKFSRNPYLIQILEDLEEDNGIEEVILMKGSQVGGTLTLLCWLTYSADITPGPILVLQPKEKLAEIFSKKKLGPILNNCEQLQGKIRESEVTKNSDTLDMKPFPGGFIVVGHAGSTNYLRSISIKKIGFDEVSDYPTESQKQGDPCRLALERTSPYDGRKKIF